MKDHDAQSRKRTKLKILMAIKLIYQILKSTAKETRQDPVKQRKTEHNLLIYDFKQLKQNGTAQENKKNGSRFTRIPEIISKQTNQTTQTLKCSSSCGKTQD